MESPNQGKKKTAVNGGMPKVTREQVEKLLLRKDLKDFVASFSELIKNTGIYWKYALDTEKNEIMRIIFSELSISSENRNFLGNKGFNLLLRRSSYHLRTLCASDGI